MMIALATMFFLFTSFSYYGYGYFWFNGKTSLALAGVWRL